MRYLRIFTATSRQKQLTLLACLILSGVLSWLNLRGVAWRLQLAGPLRAGHDASAALELRNEKTFLPTYGLWFDFAARSLGGKVRQRAESTECQPTPARHWKRPRRAAECDGSDPDRREVC